MITLILYIIGYYRADR